MSIHRKSINFDYVRVKNTIQEILASLEPWKKFLERVTTLSQVLTYVSS